MEIINWIVNYRRFLKRRNCSLHTIRDYMGSLRHFVLWLDVSVEEVTNKKILEYIDVLSGKGLQPKTINCYLDGIRGFYVYLRDEEGIVIPNPVKRGYVDEPIHWRYSSARNYAGLTGLLEVTQAW